jgi:hypothetical protein
VKPLRAARRATSACGPKSGHHPAPIAWFFVLLLVLAVSPPASANPAVQLVKDIHPGTAGSEVHKLAEVAGTLYFAANEGPTCRNHGRSYASPRHCPCDTCDSAANQVRVRAVGRGANLQAGSTTARTRSTTLFAKPPRFHS